MSTNQGRPLDHLVAPARRLHVFVPALMSVGFAFWLGALTRDYLRRHGDATLERRARVAGPVVAEVTRSGSAVGVTATGLRPRRTYLLLAAPLLLLAGFLAVVAVQNYVEPGGEVSGIGWFLALLLAIAVAVGVAGGALLAVAVFGAGTPGTSRLAATTPVGAMPDRPAPDGASTDGGTPEGEPPRRVTVAMWVAAAAAVVLALVVDVTTLLEGLDERVAEALADDDWLEPLEALDPLGSRLATVIAAALLGLASFRCRPLLIAYPTVVVAGFVANNLGRAFVPRERPPAGIDIGEMDSFPSGHLIQLTLILGLLPLTLQVLTRRHHRFWSVGVASAVVVGLSGVHRIRHGAHWPSDVVAGVLIGLSLVFVARWIVAHERWHRRCNDCPWHEDVAEAPPLRGAVPVAVGSAQLFRLLAHVSAAAASLLLVFLATTRGVPLDAEGVFLDERVQRLSQLGLAGLVSLGAVVSWKWDAVGAVLLAIAATGLGILAAVQYEPIWAFGMTLVILAPAVLLWLSWQHHRRAGEIIGLAAVTVSLAGASWFGIQWVYAATLGPTHPDSTAVLAPVDPVEWVWTGGVSADGATIVARLDDDHESARLVLEPGGIATGAVPVGDDELVRFEVDGLVADTEYGFAIEVDGELDEGRGEGTFRTPGSGATSFRFVAGSCARSGTNGAVFDAIAAEDPLFMLALGDLHYSNIGRADAGLFDAAFDRLLGQPGPAELFRDVPISYVWDDHDYGPDDADGSSPTRDVARQVFRRTVPSHELAEVDDGPIHRAYTIGRVRFVVVDTRSARTEATMLGAAQLDWLIDELVSASQTHALVVWANPTPWVGPADETSDLWAGRAAERAFIADEIAAAGIDNLLMVSGDAHMLAFDDGTNTGYQREGGAGFPLVHAAALDRPGNVKGGPYSGGTFPGGGQYAVVDVHDDGATIVVEIEGKTWDGEVLIGETLEFPT